MNSRILIEPGYAIELRAWAKRAGGAMPQPDFLVVYRAGAVMLINPHRPCPSMRPAGRGEALFVRLAPALLIETATRLRLYQTGSELLFREEGVWLEEARLGGALVQARVFVLGLRGGQRQEQRGEPHAREHAPGQENSKGASRSGLVSGSLGLGLRGLRPLPSSA